jgi:hypothetical protein
VLNLTCNDNMGGRSTVTFGGISAKKVIVQVVKVFFFFWGGKVYLTLLNYNLNHNLPLKLSITTIFPPNYQNNDNIPPNANKMMKLSI